MNWRGVAAAGAALALAGCQVASDPGGPGAASPAPSGGLAAADARFHAGDYDGAETAYRDAVAAGAPGAGAHLAVLFAYEGRFHEAVQTAEQAVAGRADSASLARLTRAYDWSGDVDRAVAAGQKAISAKPVDVLAHVYFAEALADAGRFDEAQAQLKAAEAANPRDVYTRAEIYREWANYHRDHGDRAQELNNIQLAIKTQPGFPERTLELARHQYGAGKQAEGAAAVDKATAGSRSYWVLIAGGDAALAGHDGERAARLYKAAQAVRADAAEAAGGIAVIAVSGSRDFKAAHDVLAGALRKNPADEGVYFFLWYLNKLVLKADPQADAAANGAPKPPPGLAAARQQALEAANAYRGAQAARLTEDAALAEAAEAHAWYTLFNLGDPSLAGLGIHAEQANLPGFTGASPLMRDVAAGYRGNKGAEILNHVYTPAAAVEVWYDSVYHRFPITDAEAVVAGYGEARVGLLAVSVMDVGFGPPTSGHPVLIPADGQKDVPPGFAGNEIPDPAPAGTQYPVGYPVTYQVGSGSKLSVDSFQVTGPDGREVPAFLLKPGQQVGAQEACAMPRQVLQPGATYTAEIKGSLDGQPLDQKWQFTVTGAV